MKSPSGVEEHFISKSISFKGTLKEFEVFISADGKHQGPVTALSDCFEQFRTGKEICCFIRG